jgi:hypothetical protein
MSLHPGGLVQLGKPKPTRLAPDECLLARTGRGLRCVRADHDHNPATCQHPTSVGVTACADPHLVTLCRSCGQLLHEPRPS